MDSFRGIWDNPAAGSGDDEHGAAEDHAAPGLEEEFAEDFLGETPPSPVGQDERRMQVRAYNHWASLLGERRFPTVSDLEIDHLGDFAPYAVLLDFSKGIDNPAVRFLGDRLAEECGATHAIRRLSDVPGRSLLSRITDHYMQILANEAPIGFEAEFVNTRDQTILYRGILLPFAQDDLPIARPGEASGAIRHILGVINWKELVDQQTTDQLLREIDQALDTLGAPAQGPLGGMSSPLGGMSSANRWAGRALPAPPPDDEDGEDTVLDLTGLPTLPAGAFGPEDEHAWPTPAFGAETGVPGEPFTAFPATDGLDWAEPAGAGWAEPSDADWALPADADALELADWLAAARDLAEAAHGAEDRTRHALYAAIGRAWDFALAAEAHPEDYAEILADAGLTAQQRAPMTPVVKLVFGAGYDKTRLTEYATALTHARRLAIGRGELAGHLGAFAGGLKGVVEEERRVKREGQAPRPGRSVGPAGMLAKQLRALPPCTLASLAEGEAEFTLLVARRGADGLAVLGEASLDGALVSRAAKQLLPRG